MICIEFSNMVKKITLFYLILNIFSASGAQLKDSVNIRRKVPYYHNMSGCMSISHFKPVFLSNNLSTMWTNFTFQQKWFEFGIGTSSSTETNGLSGAYDFKLGGNIPLKKLIRGNRLMDIKGYLIVPSISANITNTKINPNLKGSSWGLKLAPMISFQFPYLGFDTKLNIDYRSTKISGIKSFSFYPEISLKLDGLLHVLDREEKYVGRYKNEKIVVETTEISRTKNSDGSITRRVQYDYFLVTEQYDRTAKSVAPFWGIGPRFSFKNLSYTGTTSMYGIGFFYRNGGIGIDVYSDFGKLGFASESKEKQLYDGSSKSQPITLYGNKKLFNTQNNSSNGHYSAIKIGANGSLELLELLYAIYDRSGKDKDAPTREFRVYAGIGGGYALISNPKYELSTGETNANALFNNNFGLVSSSRNHAQFGKNSGYFSMHAAVELGVVQLKAEHCYYPNAYLSSISNVTLGYIIPFKRLKEKYNLINNE